MLRSTVAPSPLVRLLGEGAGADAAASGMDFAERLALWLNAFDAIRLQAVHQAVGGAASQPCAARQGLAQRGAALAQDLHRVRSTLAHAIAQDPLALARLTPAVLPRRGTPNTDATPARERDETSYAPYRERHLELQRQMEMMINPLREHARQALARASARLRKLATLDAAFEELLAGREQALLPAAAGLLEPRFRALRKAGEAGWREAFEQHWRDALLAELDLRLQPVAGLVDALSNE